MEFKKPNDDMVWNTAILSCFGVMGLFGGIHFWGGFAGLYTVVVSGLILLCCVGIWFQSRIAAVLLMLLLGGLVLLMFGSLVFSKFQWHRLAYGLCYLYFIWETFLWLKSQDEAKDDDGKEAIANELLEDEANDLLEEVVSQLYKELEAMGEAGRLAKLRQLPSGPRAILATWTLLWEVNNGGFAQYFWNQEEEGLYDEALAGLERIGADRHRQILAEALELIRPQLASMHTMQGPDDRFGKYKPMLEETGLYDKLQKLDSQFYDVRPSLLLFQAHYVREHDGEFPAPR